jgi:transcriptional regulator NrdR family protein
VRRRECTVCKHRFQTREVLKVEHDRLQEAVQEVRALAEKLAA